MHLRLQNVYFLTLLWWSAVAFSTQRGSKNIIIGTTAPRPLSVAFCVSQNHKQPRKGVVVFSRSKSGDGPANPIESQEEEYLRKLEEAKIAIAAANEARRKLQQNTKSEAADCDDGAPPLLARIPSRVKLSKTDAGTMVMELPPTGLNAGSVFSGAFSLAWFSAVIPATFTGAWLFMVPFWLAGAMVAKQAVVDPFVSSKLTIGQYAYSLQTIYGGGNAGISLNDKEGSTEDLRTAEPALVAIVNEVPQYEIRLYTSKGETLSIPMVQASEQELACLANEINSFVREMQDLPSEILPPS